ncbi:MAG: hypothetical protein RG740_06480 [Acholeplasmataceae bacterium]|nr:hypothetical protein [Acholeplasmataceae bacterium]
MKNTIMNIISITIIIICVLYLLLLISVLFQTPVEGIDSSILTLSISIILSVFLAGAIHQLKKK